MRNKKYQQGGSFDAYYKTVPAWKNDTTNYNLRAYFNSNPQGALMFAQDIDAHAPDSFKLPSHPTFSDESIYFNNNNRDSAGHWDGNTYVPFNPKYRKKVVEKQIGGISKDGYKSTSADRNNSFNIIPSGRITMENVPHPVLGTDNLGNQQLMMPGGEYSFPGHSVHEVPLKGDNMKLKKMQKGGAASGHSDQFWDGSKWVSSAGGATYSNGVFYANGGPVFNPGGSAPVFARGGQPFGMNPGNGGNYGMLEEYADERMMNGGYVQPFAMWPGSGNGSGMLQEYAADAMKRGGKAKKRISPQQMQMMQQMAAQGQPPMGMGAPGAPPMGMPGMGQQQMQGPPMQGQPMMMRGGKPCYNCGGMYQQGGPAVDNTAYAGNRYYPPVPINPPGSSIVDTNHKKVTDINPGLREYQHDFGQRISYPGDTLTNNQLQSYVNRRDQIFNPYFNEMAHETGSKPGQNFYYNLSDKDKQKMGKMKRNDNYLWGPGSEEAYLPAPHQQYGGQYQQGGDTEPDTDEMKHGGNWIQGAVNPKHKGYCTPMTKSTCTPRRKAFAETMKKHHGFHEYGGQVTQAGNMIADNELYAMGGRFHPLAKFMQEGGQPPVSPTDPIGGGMNLPADPNQPNAFQPTPSNYDPSTDPNNPVNNPGPMPPQGGYQAAQGPAYEGNMDQPQDGQQQGQEPTTDGPVNNNTKQRNGYGWGIAGAGLAALGAGMGIASYLSDRRDQRNLRNKNFNDRSTANAFAAQNSPGGMGDYDQYGSFRPNQNTPTRPGMYYPKTAAYGGQYAMGGMYHQGQELEMDEAEIARLRKMGYKIDML